MAILSSQGQLGVAADEAEKIETFHDPLLSLHPKQSTAHTLQSYTHTLHILQSYTHTPLLHILQSSTLTPITYFTHTAILRIDYDSRDTLYHHLRIV